MKLKDIDVLRKIYSEPPLAAAAVTILFFSLPVIIAIFTRGYILLPAGYTYTLKVYPIYGIAAIVLDLLLIYFFSVSPVIRLRFHSVLTPDVVRILLVLFYLLITWTSFYIINAKLNFVSSLLSDPLATMLNVGGGLVEEKLLKSFFFGISGCLGFALIKDSDSLLLRFSGFMTMLTIALFYFFVGRREISLMTLCFLLMVKREKISRLYLIIIGGLLATILIFVLSVRISMQNNTDPLYATDSEELSPVAYSAYVIQHATPSITRSFTEVTPLRAKLFRTTISAAYIKSQTGYNDVANPVLGIGGVIYMYGFIVPAVMVLIVGAFSRSIAGEYRRKKSPVLKLLLIYMTFKTVNLFRNGEIPIVMIDVILFFILSIPALYLTFTPKTTVAYD
ncbi:hypothetical protein AAFN85_31175 [Mucilaginibacter sp. CAU 1740]|uniref:hypothetical protein n=1 Tax=Mucilaginibacter sp. CAU 1740 TaxID=3140365 RepID=UPI00325A7376